MVKPLPSSGAPQTPVNLFEVEVQRADDGQAEERLKQAWVALGEADRQISYLEALLMLERSQLAESLRARQAENEQLRAGLAGRVAELEQILNELTDRFMARESAIVGIMASTSWRLSYPVRLAGRLLAALRLKRR